MKKQVEILAPAGSYDSLVAAIAAGADAVYIGGTRFGARAYADNLDVDAMCKAIDYVHLHGRKIYLTVNTLLKEQELEELYSYLLPYYQHGLDAVIVQDIGVLQYIRKQFPDLPIHASTQMTITNLLGAKMLENLGVERVVTARELQLGEIREISDNTNLEIESFVHGALCYSYSGQCLFSSMIGGRSGNRGQCAQPCRLPYSVEGAKKNQYLLSPKDMCTLEQIPELIDAGIFSFKIEGRMKKPEYVALVTSMYRKYVDLYLEVGKEKYFVDVKDKEMLMDLYNRGGFCGGYYSTQNGPEMLSLNRPNHAGVPAIQITEQVGKRISGCALVDIHKGDIIELPDVDGNENYTYGHDVQKGAYTEIFVRNKLNLSKGEILNRTRNDSLIQIIQENIIKKEMKESIDGTLLAEVGKPIELCLTYKDVSVNVSGDDVQEAKNQPMDAERIEKQIRKTGGTPFEFKNVSVELKGIVFVPMQSINELRRKGLKVLEEKYLEQYRRPFIENRFAKKNANLSQNVPKLYVSVDTIEQWTETVKEENVLRIYLNSCAVNAEENLKEIIDSTHDNGKEIYLTMPNIFRKSFSKNLLLLKWDGALIKNYESFLFLKNQNFSKPIVTDSNLYVFNNYSKEFWLNEGVEHITAPLELNQKELKELGLETSEFVIYGYTPMMVTAQCIQKTTKGCDKQMKQIQMQDRMKKEFTVKNFCKYCYNIIYNSSPTFLIDQLDEVKKLNPKALRLNFTIENREQTKEILKMYADACKQKNEMSSKLEFTRGHFKRGIK